MVDQAFGLVLRVRWGMCEHSARTFAGVWDVRSIGLCGIAGLLRALKAYLDLRKW